MTRRQPRRPARCPVCFRALGASRHGVIPFHVEVPGAALRVKCPGTGRLGGDA